MGRGTLALALSASLVGMFVSSLLQSTLVVATPTIVGAFGREDLFSWVSGAYLLCSAVTLPLGGVYADRLGAKRLFGAGMGIFIVGLLGVWVARSMPTLITARALQGIGAGMVVPSSMLVVGGFATNKTRGQILGLLGLVQVLATVFGPVWGGWVTSLFSWQVAVLTVLPFALVSLLIGIHAMPHRPVPSRWWHVNPCALVPRGLPVTQWGRIFEAFLVGGLTLSLAVYMPWILNVFFHLDPASIGSWMVPIMISGALGNVVGGQLSTHHRFRVLVWMCPFLLLPLAIVTTLWSVIFSTCGLGFMCGAVLPGVLVDIQNNSPRGQLAYRSSLIQLSRHLGSAVFVTLLGLAILPGLPGSFSIAVFVTVVSCVCVLGFISSWRLS